MDRLGGRRGAARHEPRYRKALLRLVSSQTSSDRYWAQGRWTDYGGELCRRAKDILLHDFPA